MAKTVAHPIFIGKRVNWEHSKKTKAKSSEFSLTSNFIIEIGSSVRRIEELTRYWYQSECWRSVYIRRCVVDVECTVQLDDYYSTVDVYFPWFSRCHTKWLLMCVITRGKQPTKQTNEPNRPTNQPTNQQTRINPSIARVSSACEKSSFLVLSLAFHSLPRPSRCFTRRRPPCGNAVVVSFFLLLWISLRFFVLSSVVEKSLVFVVFPWLLLFVLIFPLIYGLPPPPTPLIQSRPWVDYAKDTISR